MQDYKLIILQSRGDVNGNGACAAMAFVTSLIRNLMGTGSLLAFPGSIGGLLCYPVATLLMGKEAALFACRMPARPLRGSVQSNCCRRRRRKTVRRIIA